MIRILLVPSSDYIGHPFPQRHNQIFERLNDGKDFEVHVVRFRLFENLKLKTHLCVHELPGSPRLGVAGYYMTNMLGHVFEIRKIVRDEGIDLVVLSNLAAPFAYVLSNELSSRKVPTILDLPDYYPTSATGYILDVGSFPGKLLAGSLDLMLRYMTRRSSAVTAASKGLLRYAQVCGARDAFHIPNGIAEEFLKLHDGKSIREKFGFAKDDIVVGYIGSVDFWLDFGALLRGMALAKKKGLKIKGLFVGKGLHKQVYSDRVTTWIMQEKLEGEITRLDFVPYKDVPAYVAALNVGTIPFDVGNPTAHYAAPNKMWEYFSQMKPVISTPIPEALDNLDCVSLALEPADYVNHLLAVYSGDNEVSQKVEKGYYKACRNSWKKAADSFAAVCKRVFKERG